MGFGLLPLHRRRGSLAVPALPRAWQGGQAGVEGGCFQGLVFVFRFAFVFCCKPGIAERAGGWCPEGLG